MSKVFLSVLVLFSTCIAVAEVKVASFEESEIRVNGFPTKKDDLEGTYDVYLYSQRELDVIYLSVGDKMVAPKKSVVEGGEWFAYQLPEATKLDDGFSVKVNAWDAQTRAHFQAEFRLLEKREEFAKFEIVSRTNSDMAKMPILRAYGRPSPSFQGYYQIEIFSLEALNEVRFWRGESYDQVTTVPRVDKIFHAYRANALLAQPQLNETIQIVAKLSDGSEIIDKLSVEKVKPSMSSFTVVSHRVRSKEEVAREAAELAAKKAKEAAELQAKIAKEGDALFQEINKYRLSQGKRVLKWDPSLCVADGSNHANFYAGAIPGAAVSNWAGTTGIGAFQMWLYSPAHHGNMLYDGSRGGIGYSGGTATLNIGN